MNMREAIVINGTTRQPALDIDPVMIPHLGDGFTDPMDLVVIDLMWAAEEADADSVDTANMGAVDYVVVWSDTMESPKIVCSDDECGQIVTLAESAPDEGDDGTECVVCLNCM